MGLRDRGGCWWLSKVMTKYVLMNMMLVLVWAFSMVVVAELNISKLLHASLLQNWYLVENI